MYGAGIQRARTMMATAEEKGEAARNPYAATLFRDFVMPLSERIADDLGSPRAGRMRAEMQLLAPLDTLAVAWLTVRTVINAMMAPGQNFTLRQVASRVGAAVHQELVLAQIETLSPELYHTLAYDFNRRRSKDVRHRMTVFKMQAAKAGLSYQEWGVGARDQVGVYLLEQLAHDGMVEIEAARTRDDGSRMSGKLMPLEISLSSEVLETIDRIKGFTEITSPLYGPCVEPPLDWQGMTGGGFHTRDLQRVHPYLVKAHAAARSLLRDHQMPVVVGAVNALQKTAWRINTQVLEVIRKLAHIRDVGEVVSTREPPQPPKPAWLATEVDKADREPWQEAEFHQWKREMAEWHTQRKLRGAAYGRFFAATRMAGEFEHEPRLYFVYFADSRGRLYPLTYGVSPQGSDMQKALLQFADGKPLHTPEAVRWFMIHGANKFGYDKATLDERADWHKERHRMILDAAHDPLDSRLWEEADNPLQFLAWCFEYAAYFADPVGFQSRIAVSMDGSCNGLQNFSAMLRDEVGGRATNITDNAVMQDIYKLVAEAATVRMRKVKEPSDLEKRWLAHGIDRSVVKRTVMTTPYGITKRSAVTYVIEDYLKKGKAPEFDKSEYFTAAQALMAHVWPAVSDVVVKSREAMDWLQASAKAIIKARNVDDDSVIYWVTPSGFLATQAYFNIEEHRIRTRLHGTVRLAVVSETDEASRERHASGLAPNFVHSMDASHLHLVAHAAPALGIDALAMIHDDYGTHAADAQKLFTLIRVQFLDMYTQHDPIAAFKELYPECPEPPGKGSLDLTEVLSSDYFFS